MIDRRGTRRDIQLKGSGPTPFSRGGDGRAALGPVLREYLIGEAMHALGIPTTRALAAVTHRRTRLSRDGVAGSGADPGRGQPHSCGHLPIFRGPRRQEGARLADYVIARHYPECRATRPLPGLLEACATASGADRALDACGLHSWRDEHRQHVHLR